MKNSNINLAIVVALAAIARVGWHYANTNQYLISARGWQRANIVHPVAPSNN